MWTLSALLVLTLQLAPNYTIIANLTTDVKLFFQGYLVFVFFTNIFYIC